MSAPPPAKKAAGLIEKETIEKRISNNEYRMSKDGIASLNLILKDRIHLFDVRCWTFDVGRS